MNGRNLIVAKLSILILLSSFGTIKAQKVRIGFDYLVVDEAPKGPIGFLGTSASLYAKEYPFHIGIRLNNAAVGTRGGYYTFGYEMGHHLDLSSKSTLVTDLMFTTGGGAESNDGSGGFITLASGLEYQFNNSSALLGYQYSYVSTGIIQGASPYVCISKSIDYTHPRSSPIQGQIFTNAMVSHFNEHERRTEFVGIGGRIFQGNRYQSIYLTAAVSDLGGYMDVYGGYGYQIKQGRIYWLNELNLGTGGGGKAATKGGGLVGVQSEIQYQLDHAIIGVNAGVLKAIDAPYYAQYTSLHLGIPFGFNTASAAAFGGVPVDLTIESSVKTYVGSSGFSNIGIAFELYKKAAFSVRGESYWAFTDGRGAYAEGLFGLRLAKYGLFLESQIGAGAGGGINLWGAAALAFVNAGVNVPISPKLDLGLKCIYNAYSSSAFPTYGYQLGVQYRIPFTKA
jgi:hypothetical protein